MTSHSYNPDFFKRLLDKQARHILVSGHSGAGKSTLADQLAQKLNMPVVAVDNDPEFSAFLKQHKPDDHLPSDAPHAGEFRKLLKRIAARSLANKMPSIIEGTQLTHLSPEELAQHKLVMVDTNAKQLLNQRLERKKRTMAEKGEVMTPEFEAEKRRIGQMVYQSHKDSVNAYRKLPAVNKYRIGQDVDKLIARLNLDKQARHILVSGHSGAGKSTLADQLSQKLNMPVVQVDKYPEFNAWGHQHTIDDHLPVGSPHAAEFRELLKSLAARALKTETPSIIEGTQLAHLSPEELAQHKLIAVDTPVKKLLEQRLERKRKRMAEKGEVMTPEFEAKMRRNGQMVYQSHKDSVNAYRKLPAVNKYRIGQDLDKLIARLNLSKQADYYHGSSVDNIAELEPRTSRVLSNEKAVFATPERDVALTFAAPWRDSDIEHGSVNGQFYMREKYPNAFQKIYGNKPGYIYSFKEDGFASDPRLTKSERINKNKVAVLNKEAIQDILAELKKSKFKLYSHGQKTDWEQQEKQAKTLYHGSPTDNLLELLASKPRSKTTEHPEGVYGTDNINHAALYALAKDRRGMAVLGGANPRLLINKANKLSPEGYVYEYAADNAIAPPADEPYRGWHVAGNVKPIKKHVVKLLDHLKNIEQFESKDELKKRWLELNKQANQFDKQLETIAKQDQAERNEYRKNYLEPLGYEAGIKKWLQDKNRQPDDVFDDKKNHASIKTILSEIIQKNKPLAPTQLRNAFLVTQHLDANRPAQQAFLGFLQKHHPESESFKYLHDRLSCASTGKQTFGTQDICKKADDQTLVHFSSNKYDKLRPLTYDELVKDRTRGRWENQPDKAEAYVKDRKVLENYLRKRLASKGIDYDKTKSFLYATLKDKHQFQNMGDYQHEAALTPDIVNQSFFDVVGDGKSRTMFGQKGLQSALKRWDMASKRDALKPSEYMGMTIYPRIEVITPAEIAVSHSKQADNYTLYRGVKTDPLAPDPNYLDLLRRAIRGELSGKEQRMMQELARRQRSYFTPDKGLAENKAGKLGKLLALDLTDDDLSKVHADYNNLGKPNQALVVTVPPEIASRAKQASSPFDSFQLEKRRGEYKQFVDPNDTTSVFKDYPLKGVTYPTDYGYLPDYLGEDDAELDVFKGTGNNNGYIKVRRPDVKGGLETKLLYNLKKRELANVLKAFQPVLEGKPTHLSQEQLLNLLANFKQQKQAAVYQLDGDVQGVGLRKTLHALLDELNHPGVAVNDAYAGNVRATIPGSKAKQKKILDLLRQKLNQNRGADKPLQEGVDYKITPLSMREKLRNVTFSDKDLADFHTKQKFTVLPSKPIDEQRQWLIDRYRLKLNDKNELVGKVPAMAYDQLYKGVPIYAGQMVS